MFKPPPYLYKYCSASRASQIIRDLTFYFTPAQQLNDLLEYRAQLLYHEDEESKFRVFAKRLLAEHHWKNYEKAIDDAKSPDFSKDVDSTYSDMKSQFAERLKGAMKYSGVTCFSSDSNNQQLWTTNGDNNKGACIEFSTSTNKFRLASNLMPVYYIRKIKSLCISDFITNEMTLDTRLVESFLCSKTLDQSAQREWRLLILADQLQTKKSLIISFKREAVNRILLGSRINASDEKKIRRVAEKYSPAIPISKRMSSNSNEGEIG